MGANKNSIKIIGDHTGKYVQAYFEYDGKKSGGVTRSHLRFGDSPIRATYLVSNADFVACHNEAYIGKYDLTGDLKDGGSLLLASEWTTSEALTEHLPAAMRRDIARRHIHLYVIDSVHIGERLGLGTRTNTILQVAFFKITGIIPIEKAVEYMKAAIVKSYGKKGREGRQHELRRRGGGRSVGGGGGCARGLGRRAGRACRPRGEQAALY